MAVPVSVPNKLFLESRSGSIQQQAAGELALIAFYYLLRVGEYTRPQSKARNAKRTINFRIRDIGFFKNGKILSRHSPLAELLTADACTLKITNQKNGRMGQTIHHVALTNGRPCPVRALATRVFHILQAGGTADSCLCDYYNTTTNTWHSIDPQYLITQIRATVKQLNLHQQGIDPDLVGVHSLRAGGAMALKLHGCTDTTIQKLGRWSSTTFLQYIHEQIAHLSNDLSEHMSEPLPFLNIAAIEPA